MNRMDFRLPGGVKRDPAIDAWMKERAGELGSIAQEWFHVMRESGDDVRELMHDGCPVACVEDAPFGYVNAFKAHVNPIVALENGSVPLFRRPEVLQDGPGSPS